MKRSIYIVTLLLFSLSLLAGFNITSNGQKENPLLTVFGCEKYGYKIVYKESEQDFFIYGCLEVKNNSESTLHIDPLNILSGDKIQIERVGIDKLICNSERLVLKTHESELIIYSAKFSRIFLSNNVDSILDNNIEKNISCQMLVHGYFDSKIIEDKNSDWNQVIDLNFRFGRKYLRAICKK